MATRRRRRNGVSKRNIIACYIVRVATPNNRRENLSKWQSWAESLRHVAAPLTTFIFLADRRA